MPKPVDKEKRSLIKWEPFQKVNPTEDQVREWFTKFKNANIALVTGPRSNLLVIDTDTPEAMQNVQDYLPENILTPIPRTPHGGKHFYFQYIDGFTNRARVAPGIDIRTQGGYIVVDPSMNGNGLGWRWLEGLSLHEVRPAQMPDALLTYIKEFAFSLYKGSYDKVKDVSSNVVNMFTEGRRDEDLFHAANCLVKGGMDIQEISQILNILAESCKPEFPKRELQEKINSAIKRAERKERNLTQEIKE